MSFQPAKTTSSKKVHAIAFGLFLTIPIVAFVIAQADLSFDVKFFLFALTLPATAVIYFWLYRFNEKRSSLPKRDFLNDSGLRAVLEGRINRDEEKSSDFYNFSTNSTILSEDLEAKVAALREMRVLLGSALGLADSFRMVSSQFADFVPFDACALYQQSETRQKLFVAKAVGDFAEDFEHLIFEAGEGFAYRIFNEKRALTDNLAETDNIFFPEHLQNIFNNAAAVPLVKNGEVFAVLAFYTKESDVYDKNSVYCLEKLAPPASDFLHQSLTVERNQANALTDSLTQLPNERAFCLILEQQIAECIRFRGARTFTVLSFDIEDFSEINRRYGHLAGDRILSSVAFLVKQQLRQMDVIARSHGNEFLIILPTVDGDAAKYIADRISENVASCSFDIAPDKALKVKINFGYAEFMRHGETLAQMIRAVNLDRKQKKVVIADEFGIYPQKRVLPFRRREFDN
jgi:diguanylate cyclase (GGDEF)-like protein